MGNFLDVMHHFKPVQIDNIIERVNNPKTAKHICHDLMCSSCNFSVKIEEDNNCKLSQILGLSNNSSLTYLTNEIIKKYDINSEKYPELVV